MHQQLNTRSHTTIITTIIIICSQIELCKSYIPWQHHRMKMVSISNKILYNERRKKYTLQAVTDIIKIYILTKADQNTDNVSLYMIYLWLLVIVTLASIKIHQYYKHFMFYKTEK